MSAPASPPAPNAPFRFERDADFEAYARARSLEHVLGLGAEVLVDYFPDLSRGAVRYVLSRQRLGDFATTESLERAGQALAYAPRVRAALPDALSAFLDDEARRLRRAREAEAALLALPEATEARTLHDRLVALRAALPPEILAAARPEDALDVDNLQRSTALPGVMWTDPRKWITPRYSVPIQPQVTLKLQLPDAVPACPCGDMPCLHVLGAIDATLWFLKRPLTDDVRGWLRDLERPAWQRALDALERALAEVEDANGRAVVTWRLAIDSDGVDVSAWLHRPLKRGGLSAGAKVSPDRLLERHGQELPHVDRHIASLAARCFGYANRPLLEALVGHPRAYLAHNPRAAVKVELARVGLLADHRGESVVLTASLDGAPLPEPYLRRILNPPEPDLPLFLFEEASRRLTVLDVPPEVDRALKALSTFGNDFPQESHAALVEKLSRISTRVPVAMPRSVMGEEIAPEWRPVLRLEATPSGAVRVELRGRPLPESGVFVPGEGARDVHVRRDGKALHARRDFANELEQARILAEQLQLGDPLDEANAPFTWELPGPQRALVLLALLEQFPEPGPELEWVGTPLRLCHRATADRLRVQVQRRRDWFGVLGDLPVEGERVALAVLLDAARRQDRFVRVKANTYVEIAAELRRALERLADHAWRSPHGVEVGPAAADALGALEEAGATVDSDAEWRRLAERIFAAKALTPRVPSSLEATLRDYQLEGFRWLTRLASWGAGGVLADDMGLGKTVQALAVLLDRAKRGPALVVAPTSVGFNWVEEARRFAPSLRVRVYGESDDRGGTLERLRPRDVLIVSYGLLARDVDRLSRVSFSTIVFDEAQALKNPHTQRARAARALRGDFKFALSGTPLENHLGELWSLFHVVFPGLLGSRESFHIRFASPIERNIDPTAAPALSRVIAPFLLRRTKAQVARELPPRTDLRVPVVLSQAEWQLYEDARLAALAELESTRAHIREQQRRVQVLAALTRLRLLASHPRLYDARSSVASSKLTRLLELIDELRAESHRALVFSQFTRHLALVREALDERDIPYLYLDGETPPRERERRVRAFQNGSAPLFLISLKAGGFGLNLTGADNVIHLDPWWNPAVEDQASDRAHRLGQDKPVTVYRLVAKGTIEEQILSLHEEKRQLVTNLLEGTDEAARLTSEDLLELLARPASALMDAKPPTSARH